MKIPHKHLTLTEPNYPPSPTRAVGFIALMLATAGILATSSPAMAFSYKSCSTDVFAPTQLPANFGISEHERATFNAANYSNNEHDQWTLRFTPSVGMVWPRLANMTTETDYDWMQLSSGFDDKRYTGANADGFSQLFRLADMSQGGDGWANLISLTWHTDGSVNMASTPRIDAFTAVCSPSTPALVSWSLDNNSRQEGMLLGTDDVHYYVVNHKPGERMAITVEVLASSTTSPDLDLFVSKTNQFPDGSTSDYTDQAGNTTSNLQGGGAFINIGANGNGKYYIGVHSFRGAAHYVIHASGYVNTSKTSYVVCGEGALSTAGAYWPNYSATIKQLSGRVAEYTQGGIWPMNWTHRALAVGSCTDKWCSNVSGCDFVITPARYNDCGCCQSQRGDRSRIPDPVTCNGAYSNPAGVSSILAHEFGHSQFRFFDEYEGIGPWANGDRGPYCGHTIMNFPDQSHTLCNTMNHCTDPAFSTQSNRFFSVPSGHSCAAGSDNWTTLNNSGLVPFATLQPGWTPDQWDSLRKSSQYLANGVTVTP